jgi:hypothetical protein
MVQTQLPQLVEQVDLVEVVVAAVLPTALAATEFFTFSTREQL